jgi:hypothetical protein
MGQRGLLTEGLYGVLEKLVHRSKEKIYGYR